MTSTEAAGGVPTTRIAKHPGEVLFNRFMQPLGLTAHRLALTLHVTPQRISEILNRRRGITAETALRLSRYFGTTPRYWLNLQAEYDLDQAEERWADTIRQQIQPMRVGIEGQPPRQEKPPNEEPVLALEKLTENERKVYGLLSEEPIHFDVLYQQSGMSTGDLSATLTMLQLYRMIVQYPGDWWARIPA